MDIDFNEFLRIMSCILIVLLVFQGLDYIVGFGINNYLFILFCIAFAFTMGSIYHNIIIARNRKERRKFEKDIRGVLENIRKDGLTDDNIDELELILADTVKGDEEEVIDEN